MNKITVTTLRRYRLITKPTTTKSARAWIIRLAGSVAAIHLEDDAHGIGTFTKNAADIVNTNIHAAWKLLGEKRIWKIYADELGL